MASYKQMVVKSGSCLAWFFEIVFLSGKSACMRVCMCVFVLAPQAIKNHSCEMKPEISSTSFQFLCMALTIDPIDGWGSAS